jgi:hypothetical protein
VLYLQPFVATAPQAPDPITGLTRLEEIFRILDTDGYVIVGMREPDWDKHDLTVALHKHPLFKMMSMQRQQCVNSFCFQCNFDDFFAVLVGSTPRGSTNTAR